MGERVFKVNGFALPSIENLKIGDVFEIFDDGVQFIDSFGRTSWTVVETAKYNDDDILYVKVAEDTN